MADFFALLVGLIYAVGIGFALGRCVRPVAPAVLSRKLEEARRQVFALEAKVAEVEADARYSPSERCARFHVQNCHVCDSVSCGDNTSPLKREVERLREVEAAGVALAEAARGIADLCLMDALDAWDAKVGGGA